MAQLSIKLLSTKICCIFTCRVVSTQNAKVMFKGPTGTSVLKNTTVEWQNGYTLYITNISHAKPVI